MWVELTFPVEGDPGREGTQVVARGGKLDPPLTQGDLGLGLEEERGSISHGHVLLFESLYSMLATCPLSRQDKFPKHQALYTLTPDGTHSLTPYTSSLNAQPDKPPALLLIQLGSPLLPLNPEVQQTSLLMAPQTCMTCSHPALPSPISPLHTSVPWKRQNLIAEK